MFFLDRRAMLMFGCILILGWRKSEFGSLSESV